MRSEEIPRWCRQQVVPPPRQWEPIGYNLDSSVIMPGNVFQVEIAKPGVGCNPGSCFPTDSSCGSFQGDPSPVKPRPGRMLRDGRLMGLECDGTDRHVLTEAMGDEGV